MKILLLRLAKALAILLTSIALLYAVEDFRGARAWQAERLRLEAEGEELSWARLMPRTQGGDARAPDLVDWRSPDFLAVQGFKREFVGRGVAGGGLINLGQWRLLLMQPSTPPAETACEAGASFLKAIAPLEPTIARLVEAARRGPVARWSVEISGPPASTRLPPLLPIRRLANVLRLRIAAHFACGYSDRAIDEMRVIARLGESLQGLPFLITYLIQVAVEDVLLDTIQDGLTRGGLNASQRREVESLLVDDWFEGARNGLRAERNWLIFYAESGPVSSARDSRAATLGLSLLPRGWLLRQAIHSARFTEEANRLLDNSARVDPAAIDALTKRDQGVGGTTPYNFIARMAEPSVGRLAKSAVAVQTRVRLVRMALALFSYRESSGSFPTDLTSLTPAPWKTLPREVVNDDPLRYRLSKGGFVLYSVGWDLKDDGGVPGVSFEPDWVLAIGEP